MIKNVNRHISARSVVDFMIEHFPQEIQPAEKKYDANLGYAVPVEPKDPNVKQVKYLNKGKLKAYSVSKEIAESVKSNPIEANLIYETLRIKAKPFRHLFVEANPGFWMYNTVQDGMRPAKNIPTLTLTKFIPVYMKALKPSFRSVFGIPDEVVREMQKDNMLISLENFRGWEASEDAVLEKHLKKWDTPPESWMKKVVSPIANAYNYWTNVGKALERTPKVATYRYLKKKFPDLSLEVIGHIVRNHGDSPDFLRKGKAYNIYNNLFFFSNAIQEGWRSDIEAYRGELAQKLINFFDYNTLK